MHDQSGLSVQFISIGCILHRFDEFTNLRMSNCIVKYLGNYCNVYTVQQLSVRMFSFYPEVTFTA